MKDDKLVEEVKKEAEKRELDFVSVIKLAIEAGRKAGWNKCIEECCQECQIRLSQENPAKDKRSNELWQ